MKYHVLSSFSDRTRIIEQEKYFKFREFFLNPILLASETDKIKQFLPENFDDWVPVLKSQFVNFLNRKLHEIKWDMYLESWVVYLFHQGEIQKLAVWNYQGYKYKIIESRTLLELEFQYWSVYDDYEANS